VNYVRHVYAACWHVLLTDLNYVRRRLDARRGGAVLGAREGRLVQDDLNAPLSLAQAGTIQRWQAAGRRFHRSFLASNFFLDSMYSPKHVWRSGR
jgi:hypothetical protein